MEIADDQKHHSGYSSSAGISLKQWSYLAVAVDRETKEIKFYINGKLDVTCKLPASFSGSVDVPGRELTLGSNWQSFIGLIDEVKFHKRILTADEVSKEYDRLKTKYADAEYKIVE